MNTMKSGIIILLFVLLHDVSAVYNYSPPLQSSIKAGAALSGAQGIAGQRQHSPRLPGIRAREPEGLSRNLNALRSPDTQGSTGQQRQRPPNSGFNGKQQFPSQRIPQTPPIFEGQRNSHSSPNSLSSHLRPSDQGSSEGGVPLPILTSQRDVEQSQQLQQTGRTQLLINGKRIPFLPIHKLSQRPRQSDKVAEIGPPLSQGGGVPLPILTPARGPRNRQRPQGNDQTPRKLHGNGNGVPLPISPPHRGFQQRQQSQTSAQNSPTIQSNELSLTRAQPVQHVIDHPNAVVNGVFLPNHHGTPVQGVVQTLQQFPRTFSVKVDPQSSNRASCQTVTILEGQNNEVTKTLFKNLFITRPPVTTTVFSTIKVTDIISTTQVQTVIKTKTQIIEPSVVTVTKTQTAWCSRSVSSSSSFEGGVPLPLETNTVHLDTTKLSSRISSSSSFEGVPLPLDTNTLNLDTSKLSRRISSSSSEGVPLSIVTDDVNLGTQRLPSRRPSFGRGSLSFLIDDESGSASSNRLSRKTTTPVTGNVRGIIPRGNPRGRMRFHLTDDEYIPSSSIDIGFAKSEPAGDSSESVGDEVHTTDIHSGNAEYSNEFPNIEYDDNSSFNDYIYEDLQIKGNVKKGGSQINWSQQQNSKKNVNRIGGSLLGRNETEKVKVTVKDDDHFENFDSFLEFLKNNDEVFIFEDEEQDSEHNESIGYASDTLEESSEINEDTFKLLSHIKISQDSASNSVKVSTILR